MKILITLFGVVCIYALGTVPAGGADFKKRSSSKKRTFSLFGKNWLSKYKRTSAASRVRIPVYRYRRKNRGNILGGIADLLKKGLKVDEKKLARTMGLKKRKAGQARHRKRHRGSYSRRYRKYKSAYRYRAYRYRKYKSAYRYGSYRNYRRYSFRSYRRHRPNHSWRRYLRRYRKTSNKQYRWFRKSYYRRSYR